MHSWPEPARAAPHSPQGGRMHTTAEPRPTACLPACLPATFCPKLQMLSWFREMLLINRATSKGTSPQMSEFHGFVSFPKVRKAPHMSPQRAERTHVSVLMNIWPLAVPPKSHQNTCSPRLTTLRRLMKDGGTELGEEVGT